MKESADLVPIIGTHLKESSDLVPINGTHLEKSTDLVPKIGTHLKESSDLVPIIGTHLEESSDLVPINGTYLSGKDESVATFPLVPFFITTAPLFRHYPIKIKHRSIFDAVSVGDHLKEARSITKTAFGRFIMMAFGGVIIE